MTSSRQSGTKYGRRFFWLALAVVIAIGAYTGGWFYAARALEGEVNGALAALNGNGRRASCEEPQARGFPFRLGLFCRSVMYEDARRGVSFQARALRSAAQIYQPWRVVGELDAPGRLEAPGLRALALGWDSLRASVRLSRPLPERLSLEARGLEAGRDEQGAAPSPLVRAQSAEAHLRPAGDDLDLALRFGEARLDATLTRGVTLPPLSGLADLVLAGGALPGGLEGNLRGRSGTIRTLTVSAEGGAGVTVSGPVSVDDAGLVDAELQLVVREPMELAKILGDLAPQARREIELALSSIASMGGSPGLPLRIVKGEARLGFIPLGNLPPL